MNEERCTNEECGHFMHLHDDHGACKGCSRACAGIPRPGQMKLELTNG